MKLKSILFIITTTELNRIKQNLKGMSPIQYRAHYYQN